MLAPSADRIRSIAEILGGYAYRFSNENDLYPGIAQILAEHQHPFVHQHILDKDSRLDFLLELGTVIEVKVDGSLADALRQVSRYCQHPDVSGVIVAASSAWARTTPDTEINGKPVTFVHLQRRAL